MVRKCPIHGISSIYESFILDSMFARFSIFLIINEKKIFDEQKRLGVDGIITDYPNVIK